MASPPGGTVAGARLVMTGGPQLQSYGFAAGAGAPPSSEPDPPAPVPVPAPEPDPELAAPLEVEPPLVEEPDPSGEPLAGAAPDPPPELAPLGNPELAAAPLPPEPLPVGAGPPVPAPVDEHAATQTSAARNATRLSQLSQNASFMLCLLPSQRPAAQRSDDERR
jgi:hypothetical protein